MPDEVLSAPASDAVRIERVRTDGAELHVEVRGRGATLVLHGAPMDARSFEALASELATDHTVVTIDPRGIARSTVDDPTAIVDPDDRAADVAAVLTTLELAPAVVFGSSGGAVSALALLAAEPDLVTCVVAHEPPLAELVDDRERLRAETEAMVATYAAGDRIGYWRQMLASADIEVPDEMFDAWFAEPPQGRDAEDERFAVLQMEQATTFWTPPIAELIATGRPVVVGVGDESDGQMCDRTARALAAALGVDVTRFPGDHTGFVGHPHGFAEALRGAVRGALG